MAIDGIITIFYVNSFYLDCVLQVGQTSTKAARVFVSVISTRKHEKPVAKWWQLADYRHESGKWKHAKLSF